MAELRPYQRDFCDAVLKDLGEHQRLLGVLPTGGGKCLGKGTDILMYDGNIKKVEDLKVGDLLMGPDSKPRRILGTTTGIEELYRIVPVKGNPYVVNESHILSLKITGMGKSKIVTGGNGVRYSCGGIADICVSDYLRSSKTFRHVAKGWRIGVDFPEGEKLPANLPPYFLGIWLGDGSSYSTVIHNPDAEILREMEMFARAKNMKVWTEESRCREIHIRGKRYGERNIIRRELLRFKLLQNKHIPHIYKTASRFDRLELLAGLIDSDGSIENNVVDWISKSKILAEDCAFLSRSLGFAAYVHPCVKSTQNGYVGKYYRVSVSGNLCEIPVRIKRKKCEKRRQKKNVLHTGISVEAIGVGEYFGFEIDGDGRFLLGDFTVTHNTVCAAEILKRYNRPSLFLADAKELVYQAADKIQSWTGIIPDVEMGDSKSCGSSQIIVGTTQSLARRLEKYYPEDISLIVIDEAHRNTLGSQALRVLNYFSRAKVVGITATPYRSDKKLLSAFYEKISYEIGLFELIAQGYLSRIVIKSVPANVDLKSVRSHGGDYDEGDLAKALSPHLKQCAELLKEHAADRKTVVFLPLVETSKLFCKLCRDIGLNAVHVDGNDRSALRSDWRVICNASLLTTGWDEPSVDCVYILRPTKSQVLFSQMVGRGTRICEGKDHMLLLDPLFLTDDLNLIRPARLIAKEPEEAKFLQSRLDIEGGDLMVEADRARADRARSMQEQLIATRQRNARTIDAMELALSLDRFDIVDYEPEFYWERQPITDGQKTVLVNSGFDIEVPEMCKGLASKIIDLLFQRREMGLASPKQVRLMHRLGFKNVSTISFESAKERISARLDRKARHDN